MKKRRIDRAQSLRARRLWWDRHGAFSRGLATGIVLALIAVAVVRMVMGSF
jgi:hypothetical protein